MKTSDSITVILNYNNKNLPIVVKKFNKLYNIKDKAYHFFYPIKTDIKLKFNNKDLSSFLDQPIGLILENREKVKIQVEPVLGSKRPLIRKIKLNSQKNLFNENSEIKIPESPITNDRYKSIKTEALPKNNIKSFSPTSIKKKLPPLKIKNKMKIDISSFKICRDCLTNDTKYYCRKCNKFICDNCRNKKHKNHPLLDIDISSDGSNIAKYKEELINKLCFAINNLDNLDNIQMNEISVEEWNKKYTDGINSLTQIAKDQKDELKYNKNKKDNNKSNSSNDKNDFLNRINEEKNLINNITISTNKDPFQLFNDINKRERIINQTLKKGKNTTNKIEEMFISIENEIDNVLFELEEQIYAN